jgi:NADH-quinone oxidoreductase subunit J
MEMFLFLCFAIICAVSALMVILLSNPIKSALCLIITFFSLGGIYLLLNAEFIALMQVLVYAGAVMVLFLFIMMLLDVKHDVVEDIIYENKKYLVVPAILIFFSSIFSVLILPYKIIKDIGGSNWDLYKHNNIKAIGNMLFNKYLLPFEVTSVLLLVAAIGIIALGKKGDREDKEGID